MFLHRYVPLSGVSSSRTDILSAPSEVHSATCLPPTCLPAVHLIRYPKCTGDRIPAGVLPSHSRAEGLVPSHVMLRTPGSCHRTRRFQAGHIVPGVDRVICASYRISSRSAAVKCYQHLRFVVIESMHCIAAWFFQRKRAPQCGSLPEASNTSSGFRSRIYQVFADSNCSSWPLVLSSASWRCQQCLPSPTPAS